MQAQQNELLYKHARTALLASAVAAVSIFFVFLPVTPIAILIGWIGAFFIVFCIRYLEIFRFFRSHERALQPQRWYISFLVTVSITGFLWGITGFVLIPATAGEPQILLYTCMAVLYACALASGALATYTIKLSGYLAFALPCLLPMGLGFLFSEHEFIQTIGLLVLIFIMFLVMLAVRINHTLTEALLRETENTRLLKELQQERDKAEALAARMRALSSQDSLTGIANRRYLDEFLEREWQRAIRFGEPLSLILGDLDFFKHYNDVYGHQAGDECLKRIAQTLHQYARRASDLAARYGGEEFAVILVNTDASAARQFAESMRNTIESLNIAHSASPVASHITMSFGLSTILPRQGDDLQTFIKSADRALYQAKADGRNRVTEIAHHFHVDQSAGELSVGHWDESRNGPLETHNLYNYFSNRGYRCLIQNHNPDKRPGQHAHLHDEIDLVLDGEIEIAVNNQHYNLKPGDYIHIPGQLIHEKKVIGYQSRTLIALKNEDDTYNIAE